MSNNPLSNDTFWICTLNINSFPLSPKHPKLAALRSFIHTQQLDIIGLSEINVNWNQFSPHPRINHRVEKWWETVNCTYANNIYDTIQSVYQPGGTTILSFNSLANRVISSDRYPSGLRRWVSVLY